jgi:hypothetical protein
MNNERGRTQGIFEKGSEKNGLNINPPPAKNRPKLDSDEPRHTDDRSRDPVHID